MIREMTYQGISFIGAVTVLRLSFLRGPMWQNHATRVVDGVPANWDQWRGLKSWGRAARPLRIS